MERRKFITTAVAASALPLSCVAGSQILASDKPTDEKELYEFRTYEMRLV